MLTIATVWNTTTGDSVAVGSALVAKNRQLISIWCGVSPEYTKMCAYLPVPGSSCTSGSTLRPQRLRNRRETRLSEQTSSSSRVSRRIPSARSISTRRFLQHDDTTITTAPTRFTYHHYYLNDIRHSIITLSKVFNRFFRKHVINAQITVKTGTKILWKWGKFKNSAT